LRDPEGGVPQGGGIDLHRHAIGAAGIQPVQV
jgi:hypothetical protein